MASITKYPSTIVSSTNWTSYTAAQLASDNAAYAYTVQTAAAPAVSRNYDFSTIPANAVIDGILVEVQIASNNASRIAYMKVRLSNDGGTSWSAYTGEQSQTGTSDSTKLFGDELGAFILIMLSLSIVVLVIMGLGRLGAIR